MANHRFFKVLNKLKILLINVLLIIFIWTFFSFLIFIYSLHKENLLSLDNLKTFYKNSFIQTGFIDNYFLKPNNSNNPDLIARKPTGTKYNKEPLLLLGGSFAFGQYLNENQTFQYKLSEEIKRPVYNRAVIGLGLQHTYYQTMQNYFYEQVPPCKTVIYVFIDDHFRRMFGEEFFIAEDYIYLHYIYKNHKFIAENYKNPFYLFYKQDYIFRAFRRLYNQFCIKNMPNKISDEALDYFLQIRKNLEEHWHIKTNFIIFFYDDIYNDKYNTVKKILIDKLKNNNFEVIELNKLSNIPFYDLKYLTTDTHPNEEAWKIITPLFAEECRKRNLEAF